MYMYIYIYIYIYIYDISSLRVKWESATSFKNRRNGIQTQAYYATFQVRMTLLHCPFPIQLFFHPFRQCKTEMRRLPQTLHSPFTAQFLIRHLTTLHLFILFLLRAYVSTLKMEERGHVVTLVCFYQTTWRETQKIDFLLFPHGHSASLFDLSHGSTVKLSRSAIWKSVFVWTETML